MLSNTRTQILQWYAEGKIDSADLDKAFEVSQADPTAVEWLKFVKSALLWFGGIAISVGVIFFFAYNWQDISRFHKFALAEGAILVVIFIFYRFYSFPNAITVLLMNFILLQGALLALVGQTYQTGADPWQLFAIWTLIVTPLAITTKSSIIWITWACLFDLSCFLYLELVDQVFGIQLTDRVGFWIFAIIKCGLLIVWEWIAYQSVKRNHNKENHQLNSKRPKLFIQLLALAAGIPMTLLAVTFIFDSYRNAIDFIFYLLFITSLFYFYRYRCRDFFLVVAATLSLGIVFVSLLGDLIFSLLDEAGLLLMSTSIIGITTFAGIWLKKLAEEFDYLDRQSLRSPATATDKEEW